MERIKHLPRLSCLNCNEDTEIALSAEGKSLYGRNLTDKCGKVMNFSKQPFETSNEMTDQTTVPTEFSAQGPAEDLDGRRWLLPPNWAA